MNPLSGQRQQSPGNNLYSYGSQQDDFSTHYVDSNTSFPDPNALFNQNFSQTFQQDFQSGTENAGDQNFQALSHGHNHGQYGSIMPMQNDQSAWQTNPYLDTNPYAYSSSVNPSTAFNSSSYGQRIPPYGSEVNMNFSFTNRDYGDTRTNQSASTISPAVIDQSEQTIPPSALETAGDIWQDADMTEQGNESGEVQINGKANVPESQHSQLLPQPQQQQQPPSSQQQQQPPSSQQQQQQQQPQPHSQPPQHRSPQPKYSVAVVVPLVHSKPAHDHDDLQSGVPAGTSQDGLHVREVSDYTGSAKATKLKGWLYITNGTYETNESRLASLPDVPMRSSIAELRTKLGNSAAAQDHPAARARLEEKLKKREKKDKSKKKDRSAAPKILSAAKPVTALASAPTAVGPLPRQSVDESDSEEASDSSSPGSASDYEGESEGEDEKPPLPDTKPTDPTGALKYEIVEAVWASPSKRLTPDALKVRFASWLENLTKVRKEWKTAADATEKVTKQKLFEELLRLTLTHGHFNFIESIDQLTPLASIIAACTTEIVRSERFDDPLLQTVVLLFLKVPAIKWSFAQQTRLNKLAPRIVKNTKGALKRAAELLVEKLAQSEKTYEEGEKKSSENAAGSAKQDVPKIKASSVIVKDKMTPDAKRTPTVGSEIRKSLPSVTDAKKLAATGVSKKPLATTTNKPNAGATSKAPLMSRAMSGDSTAAKPSPASATAAASSKEKERVRHVITKPPSIFSSISASKRPSAASSNAKPPPKENKPIKTEAKPSTPTPAPAPAPAPVRPVFSFSETLASIGKPKEDDKVKKQSAHKKPPETEEERKKRLRKESRRHLRVSWPADDRLCQIKLFDHAAEDQIHHEAAEVADLRDEGRAFKREYQQQHNNLKDLEQDFIKESDDVLDPEATDFSDIEASQINNNTAVCANGAKAVVSEEAVVQKKREQGVMIAIYPTRQEIPYTPREPAADSWGVTKTQYDFGEPPRWVVERSNHIFKLWGAQSMPQQPSRPEQASQTNINELLKNISQLSQPQATAPQQHQPFGNAGTQNVQSLLAQISGQPAAAQSNAYNPQAAIDYFLSMQGNQQPASAPTPAQPQPASQPAGANRDLSSILSSLAALNQPQTAAAPQPPQQPAQQPQPPQQQQQQQQQQAAGGVDPDILAFLTKYNNNGSGNQAQPAPSQPNFSLMNNWNQQVQQQNALQNAISLIGGGGQWEQSQQQSNINNANDRKRGHEDDGANNGGSGGKKKKAYSSEAEKACKYWKQGKCHYGDKCIFKHD